MIKTEIISERSDSPEKYENGVIIIPIIVKDINNQQTKLRDISTYFILNS
jgi:hypothetical protein